MFLKVSVKYLYLLNKKTGQFVKMSKSVKFTVQPRSDILNDLQE
jgi:hypothetical protein